MSNLYFSENSLQVLCKLSFNPTLGQCVFPFLNVLLIVVQHIIPPSSSWVLHRWKQLGPVIACPFGNIICIQIFLVEVDDTRIVSLCKCLCIYLHNFVFFFLR